MPQSLSKNLKRRGALPALIAAAIVAGWLVVKSLADALSYALSSIQNPSMQGSSGLYELTNIGGSVVWMSVLNGFLWNALPMAVGVFLSLWILAPVADELALRHVIARAILAAGVGVVVLAVVFVFRMMFEGFSPFGNGMPIFDSAVAYATNTWNTILAGVTTAYSAFFGLLPLVVLAVVLEWLWLSNRERRHPIAGIIDEV